jgi:predicted transcriptional regulator
MVVDTTRRIQGLERTDGDKLIKAGEGAHGLNLIRALLKQPVVMVKDVAEMVNVSYSKANNLIASCEEMGILRQINKGGRNRRFGYKTYIDILSEGTEMRDNKANMKE